MLKSSPTPVPIAVIMVRISSFERILSIRAFWTLRILPRSGRIAWLLRSRACFAEPPAESPSTRNTSHSCGAGGGRAGWCAGRPPRLETALLAHQLARLARRLARPRRAHRLRDDGARD